MADDPIPRLRVIEGGEKPLPYDDVLCRTCEIDTGVNTSGPWIPMVSTLVRNPDGTVAPEGTAYFCAHCLARGKLTRAL